MTLVKWKRPVSNGYSNSPTIYNSPFSGLFEDFFGDNLLSKEFAAFVPAINISEESDKFNIDLSAPGFNKEDFKVEINQGVLSISGEMKNEKVSKEKNYTRKEFNSGSFQRSFTLPEDIKEDSIEAKYENGILKLVIPKAKKEEAKPSKQITIS